ncbi:DNA mismatch repair protein MutS [uncultured Cytophaga sp.]|uniref:DNA mismatch repair protein MutS n=1 Tax=uncultured Cytophaga sp. TaxID=160238 RepID=UPI00262B3C77|nr:DNA mismatch repair protein MutS [uncultured Cytophaga sp.]
MKQYNAIKAKYPGAMLLFRVGDFYETFSDDAVKAAKILGITLTKRGNGTASETALAGFPHHSLDTYLPRLVRSGLRVAICDQLEDPKSVKGIVKRGVTELVTPGVSFNDHVLDVTKNNYLASVHFQKDVIGISFLDISTGEFLTAQGNRQYIDKLLQSFSPSEVLFCKNKKETFLEYFGDRYNIYTLEDWVFTYDFTYDLLIRHFKTTSLKGFGIEELTEGVTSAGAILHYLNETEHREVGHITRVNRIEEERYVWLDRFTIRNLELIHAQQIEGVPLIDVLDHTKTPMGARMLKKWLILPLKDITPIQERLDTVELLVKDADFAATLNDELKPIGDLERLISKVAARRVNPREMVQLKRALERLNPIKEALKKQGQHVLLKLEEQINPCEYLAGRILNMLKEDAPVLTNLGRIIKDGCNAELDELRAIAYKGKDFLMQIQQREIERTGISSLKISYNKVFGYYLEVTNTHKDKVPADWIRKQTLTGAERYITEELKVYEEKILGAEDKINIIEQKMFQDLVLEAEEYINPILQNAKIIAHIDCLCSFAHAALQNHYVKPIIEDSALIDIKAGRHPVIEKQLPLGETYVPNDIFLDDETQQVMIITGPNMAGKSALLRQTALIVLMAQAGCFVPASSAIIGTVDKVFTRVGASDNLSKGESTFMVEMNETASILNNLSGRSLVLMDEIGRGTSTYDGISIAWAIVEHLHNHLDFRPKTLFATHYHELNQMTDDLKRVKNYNVSVKEAGNKVIFMRTLKPGGSEHSFGIHVAQMAGMPNSLVLRANEIMQHLEKDHLNNQHEDRLKEIPKSTLQMSLFEAADPAWDSIKKILTQTDVNIISPVEALLKLNELKQLIK